MKAECAAAVSAISESKVDSLIEDTINNPTYIRLELCGKAKSRIAGTARGALVLKT